MSKIQIDKYNELVPEHIGRTLWDLDLDDYFTFKGDETETLHRVCWRYWNDEPEYVGVSTAFFSPTAHSIMVNMEETRNYFEAEAKDCKVIKWDLLVLPCNPR